MFFEDVSEALSACEGGDLGKDLLGVIETRVRSSCFSGLLFLRRFNDGAASVLAARFATEAFGDVGTEEDADGCEGCAGAMVMAGRTFASFCCVILMMYNV
jgi:hypothetical protein